MAVSGDTKATFTLAQVLGVAAVFASGVLGFAYFITARTDANYAALHGDVSEVRDWTREDSKSREDGDAALRQNIEDLTAKVADLTLKLETTNTNLAAVAVSSGDLADSIRGMDEKLTTSIGRQTAFETYVVARLGTSFTGSFEFPTNWDKSTAEVLSLIKGGDNPLVDWIGKELPEQKN